MLIDPPYENAGRVRPPRRRPALPPSGKFPTGVYAAWYPIKHRAPVRAFHDALRSAAMRDIVAAELLFREPLDPARLNGCGLLVVNPPWRFEVEAGADPGGAARPARRPRAGRGHGAAADRR